MINTKNVPYALAAVVCLVLAAVFTVVIYLDQKRGQDRWINTLLQQGVESMYASLPPELHDQAFDEIPLDPETEIEIAFYLGELALSHDLAYLYTIVLDKNNEPKFVVSSISPEERAGAEYERAYLTNYPEMAEELKPFFYIEEDQYLEYSDRWGEFRSIFRPVETLEGHRYLLGADIDIAEVNQALYTSIIKTVVMLALLFIVCLPLIYLIILSRNREMQSKIDALLIDPMTRLRNRIALSQDLKAMSHPQLLVLDILKFSDINNAIGPARADLVLCEFAKHLSRFSHATLAPPQTYRLHGDEFALVIDQQKMPRDIDALFRDFLAYISTFEYRISHEDSVRLKVRAGVVLDRHTDFITSAKIALLTAREQDKPLVIYNEDLPQASGFQKNLMQLEALQTAISEKRLIAWYQPIFDAESREIVSYEALARIVDDCGEVELMPDEFIPVAHRYQIYYKVTREILRHTVNWLSTNDCNVSINISIRDIEHQGTREYILKSIHKSGMGPRLSFELLESEAIGDLDLTLKFFGQLARMGCRVGIDDLGKEYSNFDRLVALPLDFIKLDGGVIHALSKQEKGFSVVENIVSLAQQQDIKVTAEVISNEHYLEVARRLKCDYVQGFHLGVPSATEFEQETLLAL